MANGHMKRCSKLLNANQNENEVSPHTSEWLSSKRTQITNAGEDVEKWKFLYTVGGNVNWCSPCGKSMAVSQKTKHLSFPDWFNGKESTCQCRRCKNHGFNPWFRKMPWRRKWQPIQEFLPGESHGQKSPAGSMG